MQFCLNIKQTKMSKNLPFIFKSSFLLTLVLFSIFVFGQSKTFSFSENQGKHGVRLIHQNQQSVQLTYSVEKYSLIEKSINSEKMNSVTLPGVLLPGEEGSPDLPVYSRYVAIPQGATAKINITGIRSESVKSIEIAPAARIPKDNENGPLFYQKNQEVYSKNELYPGNIVQVSEPMKIRGLDVVLVAISPFQYNPVTKEMLVHKDLEIEVEFIGGNGHFGDDRLRNRWWNPIVKDMVINSASVPDIKKSTIPSRGQDGYEYLIITPDDDTFLSWADSVKQFRQRQGIKTGIFTTEEVGGNTNSAIENFIDDAYYNWNIPPVAVLLIGDYGASGNSITSPTYNNYCISDNIFADVDNDHLPDVIFARMTAQNEDHLETMVRKFLDYERTPPTNPDFYAHPITAMGWQTERWFQLCSETIAGFFENELDKLPVRENAIYDGNPGGGIWSTATNTSTVIDVFGEDGLNYIPDDPSYLTDWGGNAGRINNDINSGAFLLQHRDHGSETGWGEPAYSNGDINGLTNEDLCFIFSINCLTGKFNISGECFAEKFHRHEFGALGLIAATEVSYSFVNDAYVWGMFDNMWPDFLPQFGTTPESREVLPAFGNAAGKYFLQQSSWPYNTSNKEVTYYLFHHHGDAFSTIFYNEPQYLSVVHDDALLSGLESFTITTNSGAFICLSVDGEIIATAESIGGPTEVTVPELEPGTLVDIVITKQNYYRYENRIEVIPPDGPYCLYSSHSLNDSCSNGNNQPEYDEDILFNLAIKNLGIEDAIDVEVKLSTNDGFIEFLDDTEIFDTIPMGSIVGCDLGYKIHISDGIPDQHRVQFDVTATDGQDSTWTSKFFMVVKAPKISLDNLLVDDSEFGNNNGRLDAGETADIKIETANVGHCIAYDVVCTMTAYNPYISVNTVEQTIPVLGMLGPARPAFSVTVADDAPTAILANMEYHVEFAGYSATQMYSPKIGIFLEDWETGGFTKYNWKHAGDAPWEITTTYPYEGLFYVKSGPINHNQSSELSITYKVLADDVIKFFKKVSSEQDADKLSFYIDGTLRGSWAGTSQGWTQEIFSVTPGNHTFKWIYKKNASGSGGTDRAWLDYIELPTEMVTTLFAGIDNNVCFDQSFQCLGSATNQDSVYWSTSGDGSFSDINSLFPVYTPGESDIALGEVILTMGLTDMQGEEFSDDMKLTIHGLPEEPDTPEGPDYVDVYKETETEYSITESENAMDYNWLLEPEEAGELFTDENVVTVQWNLEFAGDASLKVSTISECGEGDFSEALIVFVDNTVGMTKTDDDLQFVVAPNPNTGSFKVFMNLKEVATVTIKLVNTLGKVVYFDEKTHTSKNFSFEVTKQSLPQGVYILMIGQKGELYSKKVIVNN